VRVRDRDRDRDRDRHSVVLYSDIVSGATSVESWRYSKTAECTTVSLELGYLG